MKFIYALLAMLDAVDASRARTLWGLAFYVVTGSFWLVWAIDAANRPKHSDRMPGRPL